MSATALATGSQLARVLIGGTASLLICIFLSPKFISFLRIREFGQQVRDDGPADHLLTKAGTPTMGGVIMLTALAAPFLILSQYDWKALSVLFVTIACALVGFVDDYMKLVRRRSLGLRAKTKMVALALISVGLWQLAVHKAGLSSNLNLHIGGRLDDPVVIHLGILYPVIVYLCVAGTTNGVNLTDGLDGLAAGCAAIVLLAFVLITSISFGDQDLALFASCLLGVSVGFLWFNAFPATIFMGDTGSFALGGAIAGLAVMTQTELLLILIGGIFVLEALSVLIQVVSFQAFRRRVFLMAPIHHHFELKGWSETKIILRFWIIASVGAAIGFVIYQHSIHK